MTSKEPPMHTLYFTRHGETVWNVENKICGMTDSPLTERGRQQARELGLYMQKYCGCIFSEEDRYAKQIARDLAIPLKHFPTK